MRYEEISSKLPLAPAGEMVLGLDSMRQLMGHFDHPENKLATIHIAGTNGKGSTAKMIATILQKAGYKVGLYTSPSLVHFNERIQINGQEISDQDLMKQVDRMANKVPKQEYYTEFEVFTGLAWLAFESAEVDIVILEVGLGGRLDATNIIEKPLLTIITKVALDHQHILGDTLAEIAGEKAGIIKENVPVILYPQAPEADLAISAIADEKRASVTRVRPADILPITSKQADEQRFTYKGESYDLALLAPYQITNAAVAVEAMLKINNLGFTVSNQAIQAGLREVQWPARFEKIASQPDVIIDGSHNVDGIKSFKEAILTYYPNQSGQERIAIVGMLADKDVDTVVQEMASMFTKIITVTPDSNRALPARELAALFTEVVDDDVVVEVAADNQQAIQLAKSNLREKDVLFVFGSFYLVGYLRDEWMGQS